MTASVAYSADNDDFASEIELSIIHTLYIMGNELNFDFKIAFSFLKKIENLKKLIYMISIDHNFLFRRHILHTKRAYLVVIISFIGYHWLFPSLLVVKLVFLYPCSGSQIIVDPGRE